MSQIKVHQGWYIGFLVAWGLIGAIATPQATAQITPDSTLGNEGSRVIRNVTIRGGNADRIDGGATRGSNLFHSFLNFNVNEGQRVYFANPVGVQNILTRVTGNTASDIMGTLGVDGSANLFVLNPNGIIFGPNAQLDISGSFTASTANSFTFPGGSEFSAANPGDSSLLSVAVPLGVQYGAASPGAIANAGNLSVGQSLSLSGGSVTSSGQLAAPAGQLLVEGVAGDVQVRQAVAQTATLTASNNLILQESQLQTAGDLNLQAGNTVQVRDSVANPFVAYAGGDLTVQGNQAVDIFALNHPSSGLVSGGDMVLRSADTVGGDAHYWTGGSFRIEQLDGNLGSLFSPYDPIIRSSGDVSFDTYEGASLHIFAGGSVNIRGTVTITGADDQGTGFQETVELSTLRSPIDPQQPGDQPTTVAIDGVGKPTLDIRAGTTLGIPSPPDPSILIPNPFPQNSITPNPPTTTSEPGENANITIGRIQLVVDGQVFLNNQYFPNNPNSLTGSITVEESIVAAGGSIVIDSRGDITIKNDIDASRGGGDGGQLIQLLSRRNITTGGIVSNGSTGGSGGTVIFNALGNITTGSVRSDSRSGDQISGNGDIRVISGGAITANGSILSSADNGTAGNITLRAHGNITTGSDLDQTISQGASVSSRINSRPVSSGINGRGDAGSISLTSETGLVNTTAGRIESSTPNAIELIPNARNGGNISITASNGDIRTGAIRSFVGTFEPDQNFSFGGFGNSGDVDLDSGGTITVNSPIESFTGIGQGGKIDLTADLSISSTDRITSFATGGANGDAGSGGNITLTANDGNIEIGDVLSLVGSFLLPGRDALNDSLTGGNGDAGDITLSADRGTISTDRIASFVGTGDAGNVVLNTGDTINIFSIRSFAGSYLGNNRTSPGDGNAGDITITSTRGNITLDPEGSRDILAFSSNSNFSQLSEITLTANQGSVILNRARLNTTNEGSGLAGNIAISGDEIDIINNSNIESRGSSGRISINSLNGNSSDNPVVIRNSILNTETVPGLNGQLSNPRGEINIQALGRLEISRSRLTTSTNSNRANAGGITLNANEGDVTINQSTLSSTTNIGAGSPDALGIPNISIEGNSIDVRNSSNITTSTNSDRANAGSITLNANAGSVLIGNRSTVGSNTESRAGLRGSQNIPNVTVRGNSINIIGNSAVTSDTSGRTRGGDVTIETRRLHLDNGRVSASTTTGRAGNVIVDANESVEISGERSRLGVEATRGRGRAGNLTITTDDLTIQDGAEATVSSKGEAGNLTVNADSIELDNGSLTAIARSGSEGNIDINMSGTLFQIYNRSTVTAGAENQGNGGSVNIRAENGFVLANPYGNSDILANANAGRGGDINITTNVIFGLEERDPTTDLSDINAASQFNSSGSITLNTLNVDPTRGLGELPVDIVDTAGLVADGCVGRNRSGVTDQGEFTQTGRGGLSANPDDPLTNEATSDRLATLEPNATPSSSASIPDAPIVESLIVEAQGLGLNSQGKVSLVSNSFSSTPSPSVEQPASCVIP